MRKREQCGRAKARDLQPRGKSSSKQSNSSSSVRLLRTILKHFRVVRRFLLTSLSSFIAHYFSAVLCAVSKVKLISPSHFKSRIIYVYNVQHRVIFRREFEGVWADAGVGAERAAKKGFPGNFGVDEWSVESTLDFPGIQQRSF